MRVLVTGSAGFIFSNFVIYAIQETDWSMCGVDKLTYAGSLYNALQSKRYKLHIGDVCDKHFISKIFQIEKPDIVIHAAADSHVDNSIADASSFISTNVVGTHNVLDAARLIHTPKLIINVSTDEVYGPAPKGVSFCEEDMLKPSNPYSASKAAADLLGQSFFKTHNVPLITIRMCNVFGPRQHKEKLIPKSIHNLIHNKKIPVYGSGNQSREWMYARDVFRAIKYIIEDGVVGEIYNISSRHEENNINVVKKIISFFHTNGDSVCADDIIEHVEDRKAHDFMYSIDSSKINKLGWYPTYDFDEALKHTVSWYKMNGWSFL